jgi:hypothetical protein
LGSDTNVGERTVSVGANLIASMHTLRRKLSPLTSQALVLLLDRRIAVGEPLTFIGMSAVPTKTGQIIYGTTEVRRLLAPRCPALLALPPVLARPVIKAARGFGRKLSYRPKKQVGRAELGGAP